MVEHIINVLQTITKRQQRQNLMSATINNYTDVV